MIRDSAEHFWPEKPNALARGGGDRLVKVGVVVDDQGILAAHFADNLLQICLARSRPGCHLPYLQAHGAGTREGDNVDPGMPNKMGADLLAQPRQVVDHAVRQPRLGQDVHRDRGKHRCLFRRAS